AVRGDCGAEQGVELLGGEAGDGGRDGLGIAGGDLHLGADAVLALADLFGDVGRQALGPEGLAEDDVVDGLVDDLFEAGHVDARLLGIEVDEAFEVGVVEGFVTGIAAVLGAADADDLLDADDADAGEADPGGRGLGLCVAARCGDGRSGIGHRFKYAGPVARGFGRCLKSGSNNHATRTYTPARLSARSSYRGRGSSIPEFREEE